MQWRGLWLGFAVALAAGCGDDDGSGPDGGGTADAGEPEDLSYTAEPDPAELDECTTTPPPAGQARAKHVSCEDELLGGTVAMGRVGADIVLENRVARFVVRGSGGAASFLGVGTGGLVDAAAHGRPDLIKDVVPFGGFSAAGASEVVVTRAGGESVSARALFEMEVVGLLAAVLPTATPERIHGAIDYELRADEPVLRVTVRATTTPGTTADSFPTGFVMLVGGAADLIHPWGEGAAAVLDGPESATVLRVPGEGTLSEIQSITFLEGGQLVARRGEEVSYELRVAVGETAAEAFAAAYAGEEGLAELELAGAPGDRVELATPDGAAVLRTRLDEAGAARVPLPPGDYRVRSGFGRFLHSEAVPVELSAGGSRADVEPAPSGVLTVDVTADDTAGAPEAAPVRVTLARAGGEELARLVAVGPTDFRLPAGDYLVTVSRGPEFDWVQRTVSISDGGTAAIEGENLPRVVDTSGWVAGDFHLHSEMSTDSRHWLRDALRIVAGEGLDVVASTDHDFITDYDRHAAAAGVDGWVLFVPGAEVSHPLIAHVNGYPLRWDPTRAANGAPPWFMTSPGQWFDAIRAIGDTSLDPMGALVQINHPRRSSSGLFESIGLDRDTGMATLTAAELGLDPAADLNDFDVDGVEVWNKTPDDDDEESLLDYLALYSLGRRFAMMGNSDTHDDGRPAGSFRTYLEVPDDARGAFGWDDVAAAIRARRATVSAGIFVTAEVTALDDAADTADLRVVVQAPPYIAPERLRVYAGTEVVHDEALAGTGELVLNGVPLGGADFVAVRVDGGRGDPVISHGTLGMTNPIEVR